MAKRRSTRVHKKSLRKTLKQKKLQFSFSRRKITGGNYSEATYNGFKNKNTTRVYYPGGSALYAEYKAQEDKPQRDDA